MRLFPALLLLIALGVRVHAADCRTLKQTPLNHATIQLAEAIPGGSFTTPYGDRVDKLPGFCRVAGLLTPTNDSHIRFEAWMPASGWNGKFLGVGNRGFAGQIDYHSLGVNLNRGYATAATDTGHEAGGTDASWAYKHPGKIVDFGYRALHETTVAAKALVSAYYAQKPHHAYLDACSNGGREALMEAQRFPEDFDGILAGAPANFWTHLVAGGADLASSMVADPDHYISKLKLPAITAAVLAACPSQDGTKDHFVNDPSRCHFDPAVLECKGADSLTCLTAPQVSTLKRLYGGPKTSSGKQIFPGYVPGGEDTAWGTWITGDSPGSSVGNAFFENYFRYVVEDDPKLNMVTIQPEEAVQKSDEKMSAILNATDPDLSRFQARGGKLILYHGWYDAAISPYNSIDYYRTVQKKMGDELASRFILLYMVPGMQHCFGGPGPTALGQFGIATSGKLKYGIYDQLERWVEQGEVPAEVIATKYAGDVPEAKPVMTRLVCPYPQVARYKGSGDQNDAASFSCLNSR